MVVFFRSLESSGSRNYLCAGDGWEGPVKFYTWVFAVGGAARNERSPTLACSSLCRSSRYCFVTQKSLAARANDTPPDRPRARRRAQPAILSLSTRRKMTCRSWAAWLRASLALRSLIRSTIKVTSSLLNPWSVSACSMSVIAGFGVICDGSDGTILNDGSDLDDRFSSQNATTATARRYNHYITRKRI